LVLFGMLRVVKKAQKNLKLKRGVKVLLIIVGAFVVLEVVALVWLLNSVSRYSTFWTQKANDSGDITYLALGDSTAQGIGASSPMRGYVGLIAKDIANKTGKSVRVVNVSKTGAKMEDYLKNQTSIAATLRPDIVTIQIGANDLAKYNATEYRAKFKQVLKTLPEGSFVSNMPLFNSRPGSTQNAKQASKIIEEELSKYPKLKFVDLQTETQQNQSIFGFAPDLFHPNNLSYKNWANAFLKEINKTDI
jgi:acyl-CoA thioesterase-1